MKYGYLVIYNNSVPSVIPNVIKYISSFFPLMIFICLSIFKNDKNVIILLVMYFTYLCYTLLTGVRGEFCIGIILIAIYIFVNQFIIKRKCFNKKKITILLVVSEVVTK